MQPKVFSQTRKVVEADIDALQHVNNLKYIEWVLEVSELHWVTIIPEQIRNTYGWVVMEQHIFYKKAALLGDEVVLKTWIKRVEGAKSWRKIQVFLNDTKTLLLEAETLWCFVKLSNLRPMRIPLEVTTPFFSEK